MNLLILDEIDRLETKDNEHLYKVEAKRQYSRCCHLPSRACLQLFEWPVLPDSNVIVIGVANALDLTGRHHA